MAALAENRSAARSDLMRQPDDSTAWPNGYRNGYTASTERPNPYLQ